MNENRWVLVGVVGASHGVRGQLRLKSYTEEPLGIAAYGPLRAGASTLTIAEARVLKDDMLVVRFVGIGDRTAASALTNQRLYVERDRLPPAEEGEFYHTDLVGLQARDREGAVVGRILAVQNFGAGDLLEIEPAGEGETFLVAFTRNFVTEVDVAEGYVNLSDAALPRDDEPSDETESD